MAERPRIVMRSPFKLGMMLSVACLIQRRHHRRLVRPCALGGAGGEAEVALGSLDPWAKGHATHVPRVRCPFATSKQPAVATCSYSGTPAQSKGFPPRVHAERHDQQHPLHIQKVRGTLPLKKSFYVIPAPLKILYCCLRKSLG